MITSGSLLFARLNWWSANAAVLHKCGVDGAKLTEARCWSKAERAFDYRLITSFAGLGALDARTLDADAVRERHAAPCERMLRPFSLGVKEGSTAGEGKGGGEAAVPGVSPEAFSGPATLQGAASEVLAPVGVTTVGEESRGTVKSSTHQVSRSSNPSSTSAAASPLARRSSRIIAGSSSSITVTAEEEKSRQLLQFIAMKERKCLELRQGECPPPPPPSSAVNHYEQSIGLI